MFNFFALLTVTQKRSKICFFLEKFLSEKVHARFLPFSMVYVCQILSKSSKVSLFNRLSVNSLLSTNKLLIVSISIEKDEKLKADITLKSTFHTGWSQFVAF